MKFKLLPSWQKTLVLVLTLSVLLAEATLGPGDKKKKKSSASNSGNTPKQTAATNRTPVKPDIKSFGDLIRPDVATTDEILAFHDAPVASAQIKHFPGRVLGYVTPWNSHGYDVSKLYAAKIDFSSPVWLQIKRTGQLSYELTGTHDIDAGWMQDVRAAREIQQQQQQSKDSSSAPVRVIPRVLFEKLRMEDLHALNNEDEKQALAKMLVDNARQYDFDGYVFEIYLQLGGHGKTEINHLVSDIAEKLHAADKLLYLVIPPPIKNLNGNLFLSYQKALLLKENLKSYFNYSFS